MDKIQQAAEEYVKKYRTAEPLFAASAFIAGANWHSQSLSKGDGEIEQMAIQDIKLGWGILFLRSADGGTYGEFIGKRPYPIKFWNQVDIWVRGYKASTPPQVQGDVEE